MFKLSHKKIANKEYDYIIRTCNSDTAFNRHLLLIGSVLPDIVSPLPLHTLKNTEKRFKKVIIDYVSGVKNKSLLLGEIFHYICDYFCYAHNFITGVIGPDLKKHIKYEQKLQDLILKSDLSITGLMMGYEQKDNNNKDEGKDDKVNRNYIQFYFNQAQYCWDSCLNEIKESIGFNLKSPKLLDEHTDFVVNTLKKAYNQYIEESINIYAKDEDVLSREQLRMEIAFEFDEGYRIKMEYLLLKQMSLDAAYSIVVCKGVFDLLDSIDLLEF